MDGHHQAMIDPLSSPWSSKDEENLENQVGTGPHPSGEEGRFQSIPQEPKERRKDLKAIQARGGDADGGKRTRGEEVNRRWGRMKKFVVMVDEIG